MGSESVDRYLFLFFSDFQMNKYWKKYFEKLYYVFIEVGVFKNGEIVWEIVFI